MSLELRGFLVGVLVGVVCLGGLGLGILIFVKTHYKQNLKRFWAQLRYTVAIILLLGQFFAALKILDVFEEAQTASVWVAVGMVAAILTTALLMAPFFFGEHRKK